MWQICIPEPLQHEIRRLVGSAADIFSTAEPDPDS